MEVSDIIDLARKHRDKATLKSSAYICLEDALSEYRKGNMDNARMWALKSLSYSLGVFNSEYKRAAK